MIKKHLEAALNNMDPSYLVKALKKVKKGSRLEKSLLALIKSFDKLHKNVRFVYEYLKDDIKAVEAINKKVARLMNQIAEYWESEEYNKLLEKYGQLKKLKVSKDLEPYKRKFINIVEKYCLPRLDKNLTKLETLIKSLEQK